MKTVYLFFGLVLFVNAHSQEAPYKIWEYEYGDENNHQWGQSVVQTSDGGYFVLFLEDDSESETDSNYGLVKLSAAGDEIWVKTFGGSDNDYPVKILKTQAGNYLLLGHSRSNDGDVGNNYGDFDIWLVMINENGTIIWEKNYGGSLAENAADIVEHPDGGYMVLGRTYSNNGDVSENKGFSDIWMFRISETGDFVWGKTYGGSSVDYGNSLVPANDGGWLISGATLSTDGDISNPLGNLDVWIVRTNSVGELLWEKSIGDSEYNYNYGTIADHPQTGGYFIFGETPNFDSNELHGFLAKVDDDGNLVMQSDSEKVITNMVLADYPNYIWSSLIDSGTGGNFPISILQLEGLDSDLETVWSYEIGNYGWPLLSISLFDLFRTNDNKIAVTGSAGLDYYSKVWVGLISPRQMGTNDFENPTVSVYPNPAADFVYLNSTDTIREVNVYDSTGKLVIQKEFDAEKAASLDIRHLAPGNYFVLIQTENEINKISLLVK